MTRTSLLTRVAFAGVLMILALHVAGAQQSTSGDDVQPSPELRVNPLKVLQRFEPAENEEYQLGPGDEISLDFPGHPELSSKHVVGPDGRITLPLTGSIQVADQTREGVGLLVVKTLSTYYSNLFVTVRIDKYGSNRILLIGNVQHPGVLLFDETPTLLDVIARGGLIANNNVNATMNSKVRDGIPEHCTIYRGKDEVVQVDLKSLLTSGNPLANLRLRRNDVVFVPAEKEVFVSVLGEVARPGAVPLTPESTLASVIAQAGSLSDGAGLSPVVQIIQPSTGKQLTIPFKKLVSAGAAQEITLHPGDIIYVPKSGFYKATWVLQRVSPVVTAVALGMMLP